MIEFERISAVPLGAVETGRTPRSKIFRLPSGQTRSIHTLRRVHYRDNGLQDIDLTPRMVGSSIVVDKAPYTATIDGMTLDYQSRAGGRMQLELQTVGGVAPVINPQLAQDSIVFPEVSQDVDVHLVFGHNGIRWLKILKTPTAAKEFKWRLREDAAFGGRAEVQTSGRDAEQRRTQIDRSEVAAGQNRIITEAFTGMVSQVIDSQTRRKQWEANPTYPVQSVLRSYPVVLDPDFTETVQAGADVVTSFEYTAGGSGAYESAADIYCGEGFIGGNGYWNGNGIIYQGLVINNAEIVTLAEYKLTVNTITGTPTTENKVYMWDIANPTDWTTTDRPKNIEQAGGLTTVSVDAAFTTTGAKVADVTAVLQEIVDRPNPGGWDSGNNVALICVNDKATPVAANFWKADGFNDVNEPTLEVTLEAGGFVPYPNPRYGMDGGLQGLRGGLQ